ncbi:unnamed protein product [Adineta ricciae]|uniref:Uncharacterized protein n=1 Tax=Adineta ricciae TaxID=249248 RepID=A0A813R4J5_ADIRI|nr:unnamed protein product [Adineta ricciae]CAF0881734.1 unnamed protein product [Adineta ricciae]CAF1183046.1 unnamed protein product [Adineta ricciae]
MKPVLSVLLIFVLVVVLAHHAEAMNKRYYDSWNSNNDLSNDGDNDDLSRIFPFRQKSSKKEDPCANKPLWYLKYQARLGKLSPFYDCLGVYGL